MRLLILQSAVNVCGRHPALRRRTSLL